MSNDENSLHSTINTKSKKASRTIQNRVSFNETINGTATSDRNEYETTTSSTSSLPPSTNTNALKRTTPILFTTTRGLHLRVTSPTVHSNNKNSSLNDNRSGRNNVVEGGGGEGVITTSSHRDSDDSVTTANLSRSKSSSGANSRNSRYSITFCDLERWSTNRANTVSLEDTFTIAHRPTVLPHTAVSGSLASNSLRFLTHTKNGNSMRFKGYARFDVE